MDHVQLLSTRTCRVFLTKLLSRQLAPRCVRLFLSWVRPLAFPFAELHEVPVAPFLHPFQVCLKGSTVIWYITTSSRIISARQFCWRSALSQHCLIAPHLHADLSFPLFVLLCCTWISQIKEWAFPLIMLWSWHLFICVYMVTVGCLLSFSFEFVVSRSTSASQPLPHSIVCYHLLPPTIPSVRLSSVSCPACWQHNFCLTWSGLSYLYLAVLSHQKGLWLCKANSCLQHQMFNQLLVLRVHKRQMCMNNLTVIILSNCSAVTGHRLIPALKKTTVLWVSVHHLGLNSLWL